MKEKIAVVTVSGRAYYLLVKELKARDLAFLSLTPFENVPLDIEVVITTPNERELIKHPRVLVYDEKADPAAIVGEAIRIVQAKGVHESVVVGVDPGKTFGVAVLSNGNVLETVTCSDMEETMNTIIGVFDKLTAAERVLKIGNHAGSYASELLRLLDDALPGDVAIEIVSEAGTSRFAGKKVRMHGPKHVTSAIKIAERRGISYLRKRRREDD